MTPAETVRQFLKAMEALDYDAGLKLVAADCAYINPPPLGTVYGPAGIRAVLEGIAAGAPEIWKPILDRGNPIGLSSNTYAAISLEPAGQLELSGAPLEDLHQTMAEFETHYEQVRAVSGGLRMREITLEVTDRSR